MTRPKETVASPPKALAPDGGEYGDFRPDGSWYREAPFPRSKLWHFVNRLVTMRRHERRVSPELIAVEIARSPFLLAFPNVHNPNCPWEQFTEFIRWSCVPVGTSAESAVKYCGRGHFYLGADGKMHQGHWESGYWVTAPDERPFAPIEPEKLAGLLAKIGEWG